MMVLVVMVMMMLKIKQKIGSRWQVVSDDGVVPGFSQNGSVTRF